MQKVPFIKQPDDYSCALASYTMVGKYFFPELSLQEVVKITNWQKGKIVWPYRFWLYLVQKGVNVADYDLIDIKAWARFGEQGLKNSVLDLKEFEFYKKHSLDLNAEAKVIAELLKEKKFVYQKRRPTFDDLLHALDKKAICEVTLNPYVLRGETGFMIHRVVVVGYASDKIVFHDPDNKRPQAYKKVDRNVFINAWLNGLDAPELAVYWR